MNKGTTICLFLFLLGFVACHAPDVPFNANFCKGNPPFVRRLAGFNTSASYFSTSEIRRMGLVLVERTGSDQNPVFRYYQHPSWRNAGWLSPIQLDEAGNVYTAPAPFINILDNPVDKQNTVYRVDATSAEMNEFISLPLPDSLNHNNPYGIIGLAYLCEPGVLYVSSVSGSDRHVVRGGIFAVDVKTKTIIDEVKGFDAMGMGISYVSGRRRLYFGNGRDSEIFAVDLDEDGRFSGKPRLAFSIAGLGPRGDDKVRRMRSDANGNLVVYGIEFNFNLIAPREKPETIYEFWYNMEQKKWICKSVSR